MLPDLLDAQATTFLAGHMARLHADGKTYRDDKTDRNGGALLAKGRWAADNERLGRFVAERLLPVANAVAGRRLRVSFVKLAMYQGGASLPEHRDQRQCDVSVSLVLDSSPRGAGSPLWPLVLHPAPVHDHWGDSSGGGNTTRGRNSSGGGDGVGSGSGSGVWGGTDGAGDERRGYGGGIEAAAAAAAAATDVDASSDDSLVRLHVDVGGAMIFAGYDYGYSTHTCAHAWLHTSYSSTLTHSLTHSHNHSPVFFSTHPTQRPHCRRDFIHWRDHLPDPEHSTVLLLHYVNETFPVVDCTTLVHMQPPTYFTKTCAVAHTTTEQTTPSLPDSRGGKEEGRRTGGDEVGVAGVECVSGESSVLVNKHVEKKTTRIDAAAAATASTAASAATSTAPTAPIKYLLYSPCVTNDEPGYCTQQFNNQLAMLYHALAVADALGRTLVLPPFLYQDGRLDQKPQRWHPARHYLNISRIQERFAVVELDVLLSGSNGTAGRDMEGDAGGAGGAGGAGDADDAGNGRDGDVSVSWDGELPFYYYPPYVVPPGDNRAYHGGWFRQMGLRWRKGRRISPFYEVKQATSGRSGAPYHAGEGRSFWRAAEMTLGTFEGSVNHLEHLVFGNTTTTGDGINSAAGAMAVNKHEAATRTATRRGSQSPIRDTSQTPLLARRDTTTLQQRQQRMHTASLGLVNRYAQQLSEWQSALFGMADTQDDDTLEGVPRPLAHHYPAGGDTQRRLTPPLDILALDFAPSYNFNVTHFAFDGMLRNIHAHVMFTHELEREADRVVEALFNGRPFVAAHLRRDGYALFCSGRGLLYYNRSRFGYTVTDDMCSPSTGDVADTIDRLLRRHGLHDVFVATNSPSSPEMALLRTTLPIRTFTPPVSAEAPGGSLLFARPERLPVLEQLIAARAAVFAGNLVSTFTATVVVERDRRSHPRDTTVFWGLGNGSVDSDVATSNERGHVGTGVDGSGGEEAGGAGGAGSVAGEVAVLI